MQAHFERLALVTEESQLGRDLDARMLALRFGFVDDVGVDFRVHELKLQLANSGESGQTIVISTAMKMLPAEKVMVRDDQVLNQP